MLQNAPPARSGTSLLIVISALIAIGPFSMEAYLPAIPTIANELGVSIVEVNYSISTFLLGMGLGQLVGGPVSDQAGRKRNVIFGLLLFILASVGIMFSYDVEQIQFLRLVQALGAGFASIVGMPTIRDLYEPQVAAKKMPVVTAVMMVAPLVAPVFGTILMQWDWRVIFAFLMLYALVLLFFYLLWIPETRPQCAPISMLRIFSHYMRVFKHRIDGKHIGVRYIFLNAFSSGAFITFLTNAAWTYLDYFGISEFQFPLYFAVHVLVFLVANLMVSRLFDFADPFDVLRKAVLVQALALLVLLLMAWFTDIGIFTYVFLLVFVLWAGALINNCVMAMLFGYFHLLAGSVASLVNCFRFLLGAALGVFSGMLFNDTLIPIVGTMLFSSLCCVAMTYSLPKTTLREVAAQPGQDGL